MSVEIVGYCAILIGAISLTPQVIQMIKTKKVRDINIYFLIIAIISDILYFTYSILTNNYIFVYSVIPPVLSHITMLFLWVLYNKPINIDTNVDTNVDTNDIEIIII